MTSDTERDGRMTQGEVGVALPSTLPGVAADTVLAWAQRAEARGFSSLAAIDRLVYAGYEPLIALAAAAAVTNRIRLLTNILIVPYRANAALLAKQVATVDVLSGGRLMLGVGIGARDDDYQASEVSTAGRGRRMDAMLAELKAVWEGADRGFAGPIGPAPVQPAGPPLMIGGVSRAAFRRVAQFGDGFTMHGGATPDDLRGAITQLREAWAEAGRESRPRVIALCYFALGQDSRSAADAALKHYYSWLGPVADDIAATAAVDAETARHYRDGFTEAGADELIYVPMRADPAQLDLLADALA